MSSEPEFQAHVLCHACDECIYHKDAIRVNGWHVCRPDKCITPYKAAVTYEYCADCGRIRHMMYMVHTDQGWYCHSCIETHGRSP